MNRRALLASGSTSLSGLVAGCLDAVAARVISRPIHRVTVTDVGPPSSSNSNLELTVVVEAARITTTSTGRVRLTYTNTGDTSVTVGFAWWRILTSSGPRPRLMLVPVDGTTDLTRQAPDCWHPTEDIAHPLVADSTAIAPADSFTQTYEVWGHDEEDASHPCIQQTSYVFDLGHQDGQFTLAVEPPN